MARLYIALPALLLLAVAGTAQQARTDIDKAKLVGTWTMVKTESKSAPPGIAITVNFHKDGKVKQTMSLNDRKVMLSGTYTVKGDQLTIVMQLPDGKDRKETMTITELTDRKFVTTEKEQGKVVATEFKKQG